MNRLHLFAAAAGVALLLAVWNHQAILSMLAMICLFAAALCCHIRHVDAQDRRERLCRHSGYRRGWTDGRASVRPLEGL